MLMALITELSTDGLGVHHLVDLIFLLNLLQEELKGLSNDAYMFMCTKLLDCVVRQFD